MATRARLRALRKKYRLGEFSAKASGRRTKRSRKFSAVRTRPVRKNRSTGNVATKSAGLYGQSNYVGPHVPLMAVIVPPSSPVVADPATACKAERNNPTSAYTPDPFA